MKQIAVLIVLSFSLAAFSQTATDAQRAFIKGNINDKTAAIREAGGESLALAGLDFAIGNRPLLGADRDLVALAVASVLSLPTTNLTQKTANNSLEKLVQVFSLFDDETVKIAVLDKIVPLASENRSPKAVSLVNDYLATTRTENATTKSALAAAEKIGDSKTFGIIYDAWGRSRWPQFTAETENALVVLSEQYKGDTVKMISTASLSETYAFFKLLTNSAKNSGNFKAEIAENALSKAIYTTEDLSGSMNETISMQMDAIRVISENQWMRASPLVIRYFSLAREEYEANVLRQDKFLQVIESMAHLASTDTAQTLSGYLADLNRNAEKNSFPAKSVVLAVIKALGVLGDKASFDNLLYVTYLPYPQDVVAAAREALASLKW